MEERFFNLKESIEAGESDTAVQEFRKLLNEGENPIAIFSSCVEPTLSELGDKFSKLEIFLPELIVASETVQAIQKELDIHMTAEEKKHQYKGKALICTVYGDVHDIGKNIVALMLKVNGIDVIDLGVDVRPRDIVEKAEELNADLVCLSALMLPSLPYILETIELLASSKVLAMPPKVMVGGGPVTSEWATKNGADGYSDDATGAVSLALGFLNRRGNNTLEGRDNHE